MRVTYGSLLLLGALSGSVQAGTLTFLSSPIATVGTVNWNTIGGDQTLFSDGVQVTSTNGVVTTVNLGTQPTLGGLTSVVCTVSPSSNCSWGHQTSGYSDGDTLLWLEGLDINSNPVGTGPVTFSLGTAVGGLGAFMQSVSPGAFIATLSIYNSGGLVGAHTYNSNGGGDPLFVGVQDNLIEIKKAVLAVTSCGSFGCDINDFSVDTLQVYASSRSTGSTPEPATFGLCGSVLVLGLMARKRFQKGGN